MDEISEQLARRDRLRKHLAAKMTAQQRMAAMADLQQFAWETLVQNPAGYAHFLRRNFKQRAIDVGDPHDA